jgi:signal transduction histidine kinase
MVTALQDAIRQVRAIATELRPSSLDDLGLLPTIDWFCRELERRHPEIPVRSDIALQEHDVPVPLKIVIYRIAETALREMSGHRPLERIRLDLRLDGRNVALTIEERPQASSAGSAAEPSPADAQARFGAVQERTAVSGGRFSVTVNEAGGCTLRATWSLPQ